MIKSQKTTEKGYEVVFTGTLTSQEMFKVGKDFKRHPDFSNIDYILICYTDIKNMLIDADQIRTLALLDREASERNPNLRFAVVTDSQLAFGMWRMWESFYGDGPWQPRIFSDIEEARQWIGI